MGFGLLSFFVLSEACATFFRPSDRWLRYFRVSRLTTIILYLSYVFETGLPFTPGGDDLGLMENHLLKDFYDWSNIFDGSIFNYPIYYLTIFSLSRILFFVEPDYVHVALVSINSVLFALCLCNFRKSFSFGKPFNLPFLLFLIPLLYFSSILLRDIFIFYLFSVLLVLAKRQEKSSIKYCFPIIIAFFIRPESSVLLLIYWALHAQKHQRVLIFIMILGGLFVARESIVPYFRSGDQLKNIYFQDYVLSNTNTSGIAVQLRNMPGPIGSLAWYLYNFYKPLPPYLLTKFSIENVLLFCGNLTYYFMATYFLTALVVGKLKLFWRDALIFCLGVFMVSFIAGTQRHFIHLSIFIVAAFQAESIRFKYAFAKGFSLLTVSATVIYVVIK